MIQEYIKKPLAEMVLFGDLSKNGGTVHVGLDAGEDRLVVESEVQQPESTLVD